MALFALTALRPGSELATMIVGMAIHAAFKRQPGTLQFRSMAAAALDGYVFSLKRVAGARVIKRL